MLGPVFPVEVTTTLRRSRYFLARIGYVVVLAIALWVTYQSTVAGPASWTMPVDYQVMAQFAAYFFQTFSILQLLAVLAVTPAVVAGTIAEERSRRTIEYLFVTELRNWEIVLGKLFARLVPIVILLAGGLPILSIVMTLGGVSPRVLAQSFAISASTLVCLTAISICMSVFSAKARDAVVRTYRLLFVLIVLPPLARAIVYSVPALQDFLANWPLDQIFLGFNPLWVLPKVMNQTAWSPFDTGWSDVATMAGGQLACAAICVASAILWLRPAHLLSRARPASEGSRGARRQRRRRAPGVDAMLWKELFVDARSRRGIWLRRLLTWFTTLGVLGLVAWLLFLDVSQYNSFMEVGEMYYMSAAYISSILCCLVLLVVAARAATCVTLEKEQDTWISLLCTPLSPSEILRAKVLGNLYASRHALFLLAIVWIPALVLRIQTWAALLMFVPTLAIIATYISMLGTWFSLRSKNWVRSLAGTISVAVICGGAYFFCCIPLMIGVGGNDNVLGLVVAPCIPYLLAAPWILVEIFQNEWGRSYRDPAVSMMFVGWVGGLALYSTASFILWHSMSQFFDEDTGRTRPRYYDPHLALHPAPRAEQAVAVEVLDEGPQS